MLSCESPLWIKTWESPKSVTDVLNKSV